VSDDAIRSLVISHKLLGTREWFVIRHTDCKITKELIGELLEESLETDAIADRGSAPRSSLPQDLAILTTRNAEKSVVEDVLRIKSHPLVPARIAVYGYLYDVDIGTLTEIPEATEAGAPIDLSECC
jgi:carbonic anhydrase